MEVVVEGKVWNGIEKIVEGERRQRRKEREGGEEWAAVSEPSLLEEVLLVQEGVVLLVSQASRVEGRRNIFVVEKQLF